MQQNRNDIDESIRFVAQHYRQGVFDTAKGWKRLTHSLQEFRRVQYLSLVTRVAAVALLLIVTGVGIWISVNRPSQLLAESDNTIFSLPDHTEVVMQEGAELTYDRHFGNRYRHVSMHGNIRFSVTHDETMPFIVFTPTAKITVLGTVFNVSENDEGTELSVISGKSSSHPSHPPYRFFVQKVCVYTTGRKEKRSTYSPTTHPSSIAPSEMSSQSITPPSNSCSCCYHNTTTYK